MHPAAHGGDLLDLAAISGYECSRLLDFSVNVRPEGPPEFLRKAMSSAMTQLSVYPSPHAEEALLAAARHHDLPPSCFAFGNGSNELIHALARVLRKRGVPAAYTVEPAFSEYALACRLAGVEVRPIWGGIHLPENDDSHSAWQEDQSIMALLSDAPAGAAVFLANPGNPSGQFRSPAECQALLHARPDLTWIIDEAFIEYVGPAKQFSILQGLPSNGIILRSLTKFHALPGVRLGYLAATEAMAMAVRAELPVWSVNALALAAAVAVLEDTSDFAAQTRAENIERRADLAARLSALPGVIVFPSQANYVLFRCREAGPGLRDALLKRFGISIRDCSNYYRLEDGTWFRAAVRLPAEHARLAEALRDVLHTPQGRY